MQLKWEMDPTIMIIFIILIILVLIFTLICCVCCCNCFMEEADPAPKMKEEEKGMEDADKMLDKRE